MTREQESITMGAHAARPHEHRPTAHRRASVARVAATALTVAVTGALGTGTALAHDTSSHGHGGWSEDDGTAEAHADRARETVRDVLADLGLADHRTSDGDDVSSDADADADTADEWSDDGDEHAASSPAPQAPEPNPPSSSAPRTTTQPIRSDVPPAGETETIPIR